MATSGSTGFPPIRRKPGLCEHRPSTEAPNRNFEFRAGERTRDPRRGCDAEGCAATRALRDHQPSSGSRHYGSA